MKWKMREAHDQITENEKKIFKFKSLNAFLVSSTQSAWVGAAHSARRRQTFLHSQLIFNFGVGVSLLRHRREHSVGDANWGDQCWKQASATPHAIQSGRLFHFLLFSWRTSKIFIRLLFTRLSISNLLVRAVSKYCSYSFRVFSDFYKKIIKLPD